MEGSLLSAADLRGAVPHADERPADVPEVAVSTTQPIEFVSLTVDSSPSRNAVTVKLCKGGENHVLQNKIEVSTGPLDAICAALQTMFDFDFIACESKTHGRGPSAVDDVTIDILVGGIMYTGRVRMSNILEARACAIIAALNASQLERDTAYKFFKGRAPHMEVVGDRSYYVGFSYEEGTRGGTRREIVFYNVDFTSERPVVSFVGDAKGEQKRRLSKSAFGENEFVFADAANRQGDRCTLFVSRSDRFRAPAIANVLKPKVEEGKEPSQLS